MTEYKLKFNVSQVLLVSLLGITIGEYSRVNTGIGLKKMST